MKVKNAEEVRAKILKVVSDALVASGVDRIGMSAGNTVVVPVQSADGEDGFATVTVTIPSGSKDGTPYDGDDAIAEYAEKQKQKAEQTALREKAKAEKLAKKAKAKADAE